MSLHHSQAPLQRVSSSTPPLHSLTPSSHHPPPRQAAAATDSQAEPAVGLEDHLASEADASTSGIRYEAALAGATPGSQSWQGIAGAQVSADQLRLGGEQAGLVADRMSLAASANVAPGTAVSLGQTPFLTSAELSVAVGGPEAGASLGVGAWAGFVASTSSRIRARASFRQHET